MDIILNEQIAFKNPDWNVDFHIWDQMNTIKHGHTFYEIFIVTKGELFHTVNGMPEALSVGDIRLITPNDTHFQHSNNTNTANTVNLSFNGDFLNECHFIKDGLLSGLQSGNISTVQHLSLNQFSFINHLAGTVTKLNNAEDEMRTVKTLIIILINHFLSASNKLSDNSNPPWFNDFLAILNDPKNFSLSISDMCAKVNYTPSALSAIFKKLTGETIINYLTNIKINYACNLLRNTNYSVATISNMLGYDSISHLDHVFKAKLGTTPKKYKKDNAVATEVTNKP